ncbi:MAG: ATP-binding protein, partial [Bacillota bacterium]
INTPLTLISGYTEVLAEAATRDATSSLYLKTIAEEADRIAEIVRSLLSFARPNAERAGRCKVNEAVERILKIFGGQMLHKGIEVRLDLDEDDPEAAIDTGELQQVLLNMVLNAIQAMPHGGSLEILTRAASGKSARTAANEEHPPNEEHPANEEHPGNGESPGAAGEEREASFDDSQRRASMDTVEIVVKDTGCGIPPENIPKIFDPFFTTKEVGKGTGLGLAVSFGIVEKHGGAIDVESEVGKGTTFTITLPSCGKEV